MMQNRGLKLPDVAAHAFDGVQKFRGRGAVRRFQVLARNANRFGR